MLTRRRLLGYTTVVAAFGCLLVLGAGSASSAPRDQPRRDHDRGHWFKRTCSDAAPGFASCNAQIVTDAVGNPLATGDPPASAMGPAQFRGGYSLPTSTSTATIGIVDAYDNPNIESDLAAFSTYYGLPQCTTANGCFKKVNQTGGTTYPAGNTGWGLEIALDVETAHGICPTCKILLVEASSASFANLGAAENRAVTLGANVISNSWGANEFVGETSYDSYFNHPGVVITASSGDSGYGVGYPAASPYVVAVGGTTLTLGANNSYAGETAWADGGSGCSTQEAKPAWQKDAGCSKRTVVDVSADADPNTGAAVYDTYGYAGWVQVGGTSLSAPLIAAVYALSGNTSNGSAPYGNPGALHDVTSGSNANNCSPSYLCNAGVGYDAPTGLGTPNGVAAFSAAAPAPDFTLAASPASRTVNQGQGTTYTVTMTPNSSFGSNGVNVAVSGAPAGVTLSGCSSPLTASSATCTLTVATSGAAPVGSSTLAIAGTGAGQTHTTNVTLVIAAPPAGDFSLSISPTSRTLRTPGSTTFAVTVNRLNGFTGSVTLSVTGLPASFGAAFSPNPTSTSSTLTITAPKTSRRTVTFTVTGKSGTLTHTRSATLSIR